MKKKSVALAIAMLTAGGLVTAAVPASAIVRAPCTSAEYFWVNADASTCWSSAGSTSVVLYNTTSGDSGSNTGRVDGSGFYRTFTAKYTHKSWNSVTITKVRID